MVARSSAALTLLLVVTGCYTSHERTPHVDAGDVQIARGTGNGSAFAYDKAVVPFTNHVQGAGANALYEHRLLEIPSVGDNNQPGNLVAASYYRSRVPGPHPMVIVLPIWGTYTYPPRKMSRFIQNHSNGHVHVLHIHGERYFLDWDRLATAPDEASFLDVFRDAIEHQRVTMIDVSRLVDWAEQRPEIDGDRVALIGFSIAASVAGSILTQEPRFEAAALVMGGAEQHKIMAYCAGKRLNAVRARVARDFDWSAEDLEVRFEPIMREVDAANHRGLIDPRNVLIVDAGRDDCMAEDCRESMWEALGRPERLTMNYDHKRAFYSITPLGFNWLRYRIWEFLEQRLLSPPPTQ
jgi:dienelactone hydrolase